MSGPHDSLFKSVFSQPEIARDELLLMLPANVSARLNFSTLEHLPGSFVDEELRQSHTDLLFKVSTTDDHEALLYIVIEHQSSFDPLMPVRLLRYVVRVWDEWIRDHSDTKTVPLVIPLVIHHDPRGWRATPDLAAALDASPELIEATRAFVPHFQMLIDDLTALSVDDLAARTLHALGRIVQLALCSSRSHQRLLAALPLMKRIIGMLPDDPNTHTVLTQLYTYLLVTAEPDIDVVVVHDILKSIVSSRGKEDLMNAGEQLIQQGFERGIEKGIEKGMERGIEKGRLEGLRTAITATLAARSIALTDAGRSRLDSCTDITALTHLLTRAITASTEGDIFSA